MIYPDTVELSQLSYYKNNRNEPLLQAVEGGYLKFRFAQRNRGKIVALARPLPLPDWSATGKPRAGCCSLSKNWSLPFLLRNTLAVAVNSPGFDTLFGTSPKMIGEGTHITCGCRPGHGESVAGRKHTRLDPCDRGNRLLGRSPTPCCVPWRSGDDLLVAPNTPQQKPPQGIEVHGHKSIACDQDAITGPEEGNMPRCVTRRGNALPIRKGWETSLRIKRASDVLKTRLREHRLTSALRQSAHHRQDDPLV